MLLLRLCKDTIVSDLTTRWNSWTRKTCGGKQGVGLMLQECGREKHFDKGLMKKSMEYESVNRQSETARSLRGFSAAVNPHSLLPCRILSACSTDNMAMKGHNASVNWANCSFLRTCNLSNWFTCLKGPTAAALIKSDDVKSHGVKTCVSSFFMKEKSY